MGNISSSSSGEFAEPGAPPRGHAHTLLHQPTPSHPSASAAPLPPRPLPPPAPSLLATPATLPTQHTPPLPRVRRPSQGLRQLVWNPFELPNRDHFPDLNRALACGPDAPSSASSSGPSIDTLSRAQEDLAAQALAQQQPPAASAEVESLRQHELDAWFERRAATKVGVWVCWGELT